MGRREGTRHDCFQGVKVVRGEVGQIPVFGMAPKWLNGVEVWRVGGKPLDDDRRSLKGEPLADTGGPMQAVVADQLEALGLALNAAKTPVLDARRQAFTFLGVTVRLTRSKRTGREFSLIRPSADARQRLRDQVKALTGRDHLALPTPTVIAAINRVLRGWAGHFPFQHCTRDFSALRWFIEERVRTDLRRKHRHRTRAYQAFPHTAPYWPLGLYRLPSRAPWTPPTHALR
jgi:hypothetical protein